MDSCHVALSHRLRMSRSDHDIALWEHRGPTHADTTTFSLTIRTETHCSSRFYQWKDIIQFYFSVVANICAYLMLR